MINNLKRIIGLTIIPTIFLTYGILALNGIEISKKVKFDDAWMYIYMAIVLYILGIGAYIGQIIIDHKNKNANKIVEKNQQKESNSYFKTWTIQCKSVLIIWIVYTVVWVMKLPYTNDLIYVSLTLLGLYCLRKEQKNIENSKDK